MKVETKYDFGDTVVLKHDREKTERMITGISLRVNGNVSYELSTGATQTWHNEFEVTAPDVVKQRAGFK